jgi:hypothetical protein
MDRILMDINTLSGDVRFEGYNLSDSDCEKLMYHLKQSIQYNGGICRVKSIHLERNNISDVGATFLTELLEYPIILYLGYNKFTYDGIRLLSDTVLTRQRLGLIHGDFYTGYNPNVQFPSWWEDWFPLKQKHL